MNSHSPVLGVQGVLGPGGCRGPGLLVKDVEDMVRDIAALQRRTEVRAALRRQAGLQGGALLGALAVVAENARHHFTSDPLCVVQQR
jgi:hypothetical protein